MWELDHKESCCCCIASVVSNSVQPHRWQPTRLPHLWGSPGKNTGVGCHFLLQCMKVKSENEVAQSCPTLSDPMDCSPPGSSIHGIFRQEYWSGVPLPSPKESWGLKNWCFWTVALEKTLESPLDCKEIQPVNPKGNQPWILIGRTDAEAETPILWPWSKELTHWKRPLMLGKIEGKRRSGWQRMRWLDGITHWMDIVWTSSGSWLMDREAWCATVPWVAKSWTQLSYWSELRQLDQWDWSLDNLKL